MMKRFHPLADSVRLFVPSLPHSDPVPNGCHQTRGVPWLAVLPEQNSLCPFLCV